MHFATPTLLASLALVPVYVWLRLRQKRPPVAVVSSLLLWKAVPPAPQEALARRERLWNLVLLVEGLSLALVCASIARPFVMRKESRPIHLVLGIDDSASMGARDRWASVQARAKDLVGGLQGDDMVTLLTNKGDTPRVAPKEALVAVEKLVPSAIEDDLDGLLARARALAGAEEGAVVHILTDRVVPDAPEVESLGGPTDNAGILDASWNGREVFALVAATGPRRVRIEVLSLNDVLVLDQVTVPDTNPVPVLLPIKEGFPQKVRITSRDDLAADNECKLERAQAIRVRIETPGNPELVRALSVQPGVEIVLGQSWDADIAVLDRTWPARYVDTSRTGLVVIAPPEGCGLRGDVVSGPIQTWDAEHPLLKDLDPRAVGLVRSASLQDDAGSTVLATAGGKPVLYEYHFPGSGHLYIGFDVSLAGGESTWATHPQFPIFWNRVVRWMAGAGSGTWSRSGLCSRKETLCASLSTPSRPVDFARTRVVSSPRFWAPFALAAAALGFSLAFLLSNRANGWRSSSSSTTR